MAKLAHNLKQLMLKNNLTESELARRTGIGQPVIHRISSGETDNPKIDTLSPIAAHFSLTLSELVGDHPLPTASTSTNAAHRLNIDQWRKVPLLDWSQINHWLNKQQSINPKQNLGTGLSVSTRAFALELQDNSLEPQFPMATRLIVEPDSQVTAGDLCIIVPPGQSTPVAMLLSEDEYADSAACYTPINPLFDSITATAGEQIRCLGVVVQALHLP